MTGTQLSGKSFSGKILLFGEHSVIEGSKALVLPFDRFTAQLTFRKSVSSQKKAILSHDNLERFAEYLRVKNFMIDHERLHADLRSGLWLNSDIPDRYGVGSSGATVAAVFHEYGLSRERFPDDDLAGLQMELASMESFFHGRSSGIDPLCSYLHTPILAAGTACPSVWKPGPESGFPWGIFLLDTGLTGDTGKQVGQIREKLNGEKYRQEFTQKYIPLVNKIVTGYAMGRLSPDSLHELSDLQLYFFQEAIPDAFLSVWKQGLETGRYFLKLCGSGGGGYLLGFTDNLAEIQQFLTGYKVNKFENLKI